MYCIIQPKADFVEDIYRLLAISAGPRASFLGFEKRSEPSQSQARAALAAKEHTPRIQVHEHRDVVVTAPRGVSSAPIRLGEPIFLGLPSSLDVVPQQPPQTSVLDLQFARSG